MGVSQVQFGAVDPGLKQGEKKVEQKFRRWNYVDEFALKSQLFEEEIEMSKLTKLLLIQQENNQFYLRRSYHTCGKMKDILH